MERGRFLSCSLYLSSKYISRELKGKIEKESTKRELLSGQSHLNDTHCIHCLQPFRFLVNSKCRCLDCHLYTCKNCSLFKKQEQGWVCDPCRLSRIVKTGSLAWYYEHVRSRFKRFGSAKVMRSLYGRMARGQKMNPALLGTGRGLGRQDRVYSLPDIHRDYQLGGNYRGDDREEEESDDVLDSAKAECYARMRKTKRLLSVHPFDFEMDSEYSAQSRRQSMQLSPGPYSAGLQTFAEFPGDEEDTSWKESMVAEADLAAMFHRILEEEGQHTAPPKHEFSTEVQLAVNSRSKSLERATKPEVLISNELVVVEFAVQISLDNGTQADYPQKSFLCNRIQPFTGSPWNEQHRPQYSADMDTSDEDMKGAPKVLAHQLHHPRRRSRASSQENINHSGSQIQELSKRMSAIERMLNRLEEKILAPSEEVKQSTDPLFFRREENPVVRESPILSWKEVLLNIFAIGKQRL
ncbi:UNVERIFIED_CONTAM: hypothetical protein K2H54_043510 [Gekko kuhli]